MKTGTFIHCLHKPIRSDPPTAYRLQIGRLPCAAMVLADRERLASLFVVGVVGGVVMDKWKSVMLEGKVLSRKTAKAFLAEYGDQALARAAARMREARKRRMGARALHWSRVAMWIEELSKTKPMADAQARANDVRVQERASPSAPPTMHLMTT